MGAGLVQVEIAFHYGTFILHLFLAVGNRSCSSCSATSDSASSMEQYAICAYVIESIVFPALVFGRSTSSMRYT